ncbi:methyltransferase domain-containing protein [Nocardiopsis sp. HNM0947]|uniref:Methyltransferase domain-containing protein n=1 Tax=Nocardiopsis coralli TaxID=2772213 RepID=A0ABR9P382_9ACTN|nr:SAM-dependent methyltransferase [Nocardiopsis coralli]MBE2998313.1 methyltransferase domain-containing protein [Nocardiopsis coralli]
MSTDPAYFTRMYEGSDDPWGFRSRWYEQRKRDLTLACLPEERYARAFEPGCSIGMLTRGLAQRCASLHAIDPVPTAVEQARREAAGVDHVRVERGRVPRDWPEGTFDLVVLSEMLYYFDDAELHEVIGRTLACALPGATVVAVHWRHEAEGHVRSGDGVHRVLAEVPELSRTAGHVEADFLLDTFAVHPGGRP